MTGIVYGLIDPRYGVIRYVGKTERSLHTRHKAHCNAIYYPKDRTRRAVWIRELASLGVYPHPVVLAKTPSDQLNETEKRFIAALRTEATAFGLPSLTNTSEGGDGAVGVRWTPEHRAYMSKLLRGRRLSPETRAKLSAARIGWKTLPEVKEKIRIAMIGRVVGSETRAKLRLTSKGNKSFLGRKHTQEARAKMSAACVGRKLSTERAEKLHAACRGRPLSANHKLCISRYWKGRKRSPETRERMRLAALRREESKRMARSAA